MTSFNTRIGTANVTTSRLPNASGPSPNAQSALANLDPRPVNVDIDLSTARSFTAPVEINSSLNAGISATPPASVFLEVEPVAFDLPDTGGPSSKLTPGVAYLYQNSQSGAPLLLAPGRSYYLGNFQKGWISNLAQASKMLRLVFSLLPLNSQQQSGFQFNSFGQLLVNDEGGRPTYSAGNQGLLGIQASANAFFGIQGSATKTIRVMRLTLSLQNTAGATYCTLQLLKVSSAYTGGTSATLTDVPHDSGDPAATAVVKQWTADPTGGGASVGRVRSILAPAPLGSAETPPIELTFGTRNDKGIVLRGVAEGLYLHGLGGIPANTQGAFDIEWTEDNS